MHRNKKVENYVIVVHVLVTFLLLEYIQFKGENVYCCSWFQWLQFIVSWFHCLWQGKNIIGNIKEIVEQSSPSNGIRRRRKRVKEPRERASIRKSLQRHSSWLAYSNCSPPPKGYEIISRLIQVWGLCPYNAVTSLYHTSEHCCSRNQAISAWVFEGHFIFNSLMIS